MAEQTQAQAVDAQGTTQAQGRELIRRLRDEGFAGSDEQVALALGRPTEELRAVTEGTAPVDDDLVMKARGLALQRGLTVE